MQHAEQSASRDLNAMAEALRSVWINGGSAKRLPAIPNGHAWFAGSVRLNSKAVTDLVAEGWLWTSNNGTRAWPQGCPEWMMEDA